MLARREVQGCRSFFEIPPWVDLFDRVLSTADSRGAFSPKREREERDETKFELKTSCWVFYWSRSDALSFERKKRGEGGKRIGICAFSWHVSIVRFEETAVSGWSLINSFLCILEYVGAWLRSQSCCLAGIHRRVENRSYCLIRSRSSLRLLLFFAFRCVPRTFVMQWINVSLRRILGSFKKMLKLKATKAEKFKYFQIRWS